MPLQTMWTFTRRNVRWIGLSLLAIAACFFIPSKNPSHAQQANGYEGDVTPRPTGKNAAPSLPDAVQVGRFVMKLDTANQGSEFQRADSAPRTTRGDGRIGMADFVQTLRYANGLDPLTSAGGPTAPVSAVSRLEARAEAVSEVRVGAATFGSGTMTVPVELHSMGTENAIGFSLAFDPAKLSNPVAVLGNDAATGLLLINPAEIASGRLGIGLALPAGETFATGVRQIMRVTFTVNPAAFGTPTPIGFASDPVDLEMSDPLGNLIDQRIFVGGTVTLNFPTPTISALNPSSAFAGDLSFTLGVIGTNFVNGSIVRWTVGATTTNLTTTFQNSTLLTAAVPAALIQTAGSASITVANPTPNAGNSNALTLNIVNPVPSLTGLGFSTIAAGGGAGTLTITGNGFVPGSVVFWNGRPCPTRFLSRTQLIVDYAAADIACAGLINVTVVSPAPGGGTSVVQTFSIAPTISALNPTIAFVGNGEFTLTALGTGFCDGTKIRVDGVARTSTIVSNTQIATTITAADLTPGTRQISVISADGVVSNTVSLTISANPLPTITSLNPNSILNGSPGFTLTVNGTGFLPGSKVRWNGAERTTTFVSATQLTAAIPAADIVLAGVAEVTVSNPAPGGGTSATANFTVNGLEADVTPRPTGNGAVSTSDWVQMGRFFIGSDTLTLGSEFQRADSFPTQTKGDGRITIGDWVQAGRFAAGLDTPSTVGGPTQPNLLPTLNAPLGRLEAQGRVVRAREAAFQRGNLGVLQIELDGQGNENALAFSLNFDARQMTFVDATLSPANTDATLQLNRSQSRSGRLGLAVVLAPGQQFVAGTRTLLTLRFIPNGGDSDVVTDVTFGDQLVARDIVDASAASLPQTSFASAKVTIRGRSAAHVSAASYLDSELSADSIASAFGSNLAAMTQVAVSQPLPTTLGGTSVKIKDAAGSERNAPLFFVSPNQLNYQIPAGLAEGIASVTITNSAGEVTNGLLNIGKVAPGLFAADASGKGYAAADVVYVTRDGAQTQAPATRFDAGQNRLVGVPIDLTSEAEAVLVLYGTGLRQRSALANVQVRIGGVAATVEYVGAQNQYAGLDQMNVRLPKRLAGRGDVMLEVLVDGKAANAVQVQIK